MLEPIQFPSPHQSSRDGHTPELIVVHADAGKSEEGTISWMQHPKSKVSYHYLIGRGGALYQFVSEREKSWGAGLSDWPGCQVVNSVNPCALNVALANDGKGEPYAPEQYKVAGELLYELMRRHEIPLHRIRGHYELSPGRKTDPYDYFDWDELWRQIGRHSRAVRSWS